MLYYVNESGKICNTSSVPIGFHYEFEQKTTYMNIMIVRDHDSGVHDEYQGWESYDELCKAIGK